MRRVLIVTATVLTALLVTAIPACGEPDVSQPPPAFVAPAAAKADVRTAPCRPADAPCWRAHITRRQAERAWWAEIVRQQRAARDWRRLLAYLAARQYPHGLCGGDLPPCWVRDRESGGDIRIWNGGCYAPFGWRGKSPCGTSSASGKWQAIRSTWAGFGGYLNAADAPERVQDDWARKLYARGRGASHWGL